MSASTNPSITWTHTTTKDDSGVHPSVRLRREPHRPNTFLGVDFAAPGPVPSQGPGAVQDVVENLQARIRDDKDVGAFLRTRGDADDLGKHLAVARSRLAALKADRVEAGETKPKGVAARLLDLDQRIADLEAEVDLTGRQFDLTQQLHTVARQRAVSVAERESGRSRNDVLHALQEDQRTILARLAAAASPHLTALAAVHQAIGQLVETNGGSFAAMALEALAGQSDEEQEPALLADAA